MTCKLCDVVIDSVRNNNFSEIANRLLYTTKSFLITPCIGPLFPGHVLIISKEHSENLSCMNASEKDEINQIIDLLRDKLSKYYSNCLIAEHGAFDFQQNSGACIIHTHLHVIPNCLDSINAFDAILNYVVLNNFNELVKINYPYILAASFNFIRVYNADSIPSQMIRRLILASRGEIENWDWRTQPKNNFNEQTINIWKDVKEYD